MLRATQSTQSPYTSPPVGSMLHGATRTSKDMVTIILTTATKDVVQATQLDLLI